MGRFSPTVLPTRREGLLDYLAAGLSIAGGIKQARDTKERQREERAAREAEQKQRGTLMALQLAKAAQEMGAIPAGATPPGTPTAAATGAPNPAGVMAPRGGLIGTGRPAPMAADPRAGAGNRTQGMAASPMPTPAAPPMRPGAFAPAIGDFAPAIPQMPVPDLQYMDAPGTGMQIPTKQSLEARTQAELWNQRLAEESLAAALKPPPPPRNLDPNSPEALRNRAEAERYGTYDALSDDQLRATVQRGDPVPTQQRPQEWKPTSLAEKLAEYRERKRIDREFATPRAGKAPAADRSAEKEAADVLKRARELSKPQDGKYGTTMPGLPWDEALIKARSEYASVNGPPFDDVRSGSSSATTAAESAAPRTVPIRSDSPSAALPPLSAKHRLRAAQDPEFRRFLAEKGYTVQ